MNLKRVMKTNAVLLSLIIALLLFSVSVLSAPPLPTEIYGIAKSYNQFIPSGTIVSVYDSEGNICGAYTAQGTTWNTSYFGVLTCRGEDNYSVGPVEGEILQFRIGTAYASAITLAGVINVSAETTAFNYTATNVTWESGKFKEVLIVAPPLVCGDDFCDSYENCNTCEIDCGVCPTGNETGNSNNTGGNTTPGSGGGGGGGGGGGSGGTGNAGGGDSNVLETGDQGEVAEGDGSGEGTAEEQDAECIEAWLCADWQKCMPSNTQIRECADLNECGTSEDMPEVVQSCTYEADEISINETVRNETSFVPPRQESPAIIEVCREKMKIFSLPSLFFFAIVILILIIAEMDYRKKIKRISSDKELDELKKLELRYLEHRKRVVFVVLMAVLSVIVYLYHYFFFVCKDKYVEYLWLLALGLIMAPIIVHITLALSRFSESQKNKRLQTLNDIHFRHIEALREIANKELMMAENNITARIYTLETKEEFNKLLSQDRIISKIYADMNKLFNLYKTLNNPMNIEKDLLENIRKLDQDAEFLEAAKVHPELAEIRSSLSALYSAYEYKQSLYDELAKIEAEHGVRSPVLR